MNAFLDKQIIIIVIMYIYIYIIYRDKYIDAQVIEYCITFPFFHYSSDSDRHMNSQQLRDEVVI